MQLNISEHILGLNDLSSTAKLLYGAINALKDENNICNSTALALSMKIAVHRNSVVRCVEELQKKNLIEVIEGKSSRNRVQYSYRVKSIYEYLAEMDGEKVAL